MGLIPGFTSLEGRRFTETASLMVIDKIEVEAGEVEVEQLEALLTHITRDIQAQMIRSFRLPKAGRTYQYKGKPYRASAPGESPAVRSGRLLSQTFNGYRKVSPTEAELTIDTGYETFLELGTRRMLARPYVVPAVNEILQKLVDSEVLQGFTRITPLDVAA